MQNGLAYFLSQGIFSAAPMKPYQQAVDNVLPTLTRFFTRGFSIHTDTGTTDLTSLANDIVMVVSTHRSQTDYFLFGWELYNQGIKHVRIAAGDNLTNFPVLGKKFRSFGAFAIHRDAGFKRNYIRDLCAAVVAMMEENEPILLFPEGGRSYGGNMLEIKGGVLLSALITQARHPDRNVYLVPAAVSYEHLPELPYFGMLKKGKEMRKKTNGFFKRLIGNFYYFGADLIAFAKLLFKVRFGVNQGDVFIDFGTPMRVNDMVDIKANFKASARDEFSGHQAAMRIICDKLYPTFQSLYRLLPEHIAAAALAEKDTITQKEFADGVRRALALARDRNRNLKELAPLTEEQVGAAGLRQLGSVKAVRVRRTAIEVRNRDIVGYYAAALSL
jgi:1-acyl-sn-glycerol-3-phosphate acyltransferase